MKAMIRMKEIWKDIPEYEGYYQISKKKHGKKIKK